MSSITLTLFGGFFVHRHAQSDPIRFRSDKIRALFAYLAVEADRPHRRETLALLLWPNMPDSVAKRNLRQSLHRLKQAIGEAAGETLVLTRQTVMLRGAAVASDVGRFQNLIDRCETHNHQQLHNCTDCLMRLEGAVKLVRGEFLQGVSVADALGFEEWQTMLRERLHQQTLTLLDMLAGAYEQRGDYAEALRFAQQQVALEAWNEPAHRQIMRLLMRLAQRSEALAQFERCQQILWDELGAEPEDATLDLYEQIASGGFSAETPPSSTLHNFPTSLTPFVGRQRETDSIISQLQTTRLLTLLGAGGMGKTRLAVAVAQQIAQRSGAFADGIYFVPLASITTELQFGSALATVLNVSMRGSQPILQQLMHHLRTLDCLLVLDNFEQLTACHPLLTELLTQTESVTLLVTSRQVTTVDQEVCFSVGGLLFPQPADDLTQAYPAVQLFVQTARRVRPDFAVSAENATMIARICQLVQGMPLALELAAGWTRLLSTQEIVAEIGSNLDFLQAVHSDVPGRHSSMRVLFEQTWQQLSSAEQTVLAQLSVFRGTFSMAALNAVTANGAAEIAVLLDLSLLSCVRSGHYFLHELLRAFSAEKLAAQPNALYTTQARHSNYYLDAISAYQNDQESSTSPATQYSRENLRSAWHSASEQANIPLLTSALDGLVKFYDHLGLLQEGVELLQVVQPYAGHTYTKAQTHQANFLIKLGQYDAAHRILDAVIQTSQETPLVIAARHALGRIYELRDEYALAIAEHEQVLAFYRTQDDRAKVAEALAARANIYWRMGKYAVAIASFDEALAVERALKNQRGIERNLGNLSIVHREMANYDIALRCVHEALTIVEAIGFQEGIARHSNNLGLIYWQMERREEALQAYQKAARIAEALGIQRGMTLCIGNMGVIYRELGQWEDAAACYQRAATLARGIGIQRPLINNLGNLANLYLDQGNYQQARHYYLETIALAQKHGIQEAYARLLGAFAELNVAEGQLDEADQQLTEAISLMRELKTRYYLPQTLAVWAGCLIRLKRLEDASVVNIEAAQIAEEVGRKAAQHFISCNQIRLLHAQKSEQAALALADEQLKQTKDLGEQGDFHYEKWLIRADSADGNHAIQCYTKQMVQQPHIRFKQRCAEIRAATTQPLEPH